MPTAHLHMLGQLSLKLRLGLMLGCVALFGLGVFGFVIFSAVTDQYKAVLVDDTLAYATAIQQANVQPVSGALPSPSTESVFKLVHLGRANENSRWQALNGNTAPGELLAQLPTSVQRATVVSGLTELDSETYSWGLIAQESSNRCFLVFRAHDANAHVWAALSVPFFIAAFLLLWLTVWSAAIVGRILERTKQQNALLKTHSEELTRARDEALEAEKAKSIFLASMSHEIRTPMNGVLGLTELVLLSDLPTRARDYVKQIEASAQSLLNIINDILDFSKLDAGQVHIERIEVDLSTIVSESMALMRVSAEKKGLDFSFHINSDTPTRVHLDPTRLNQILINLVGNAIKFTDEGRVDIVVSAVNRNSEMVDLLFTVSDTGIGIGTDAVSGIFEEFEQADNSITRRFGGTGLGLAICKQLVDLMDGTIHAESTVDVGSTFRVTLPARVIDTNHADSVMSCAVETEAVSMNQSTESSNPPLRVLVAEDHPVNRLLVSRMLEILDAKVTMTNDGLEAVAAFEKDTYDVVLMDCQMPVLDGFGATRRIRQFEKNKQRKVTAPIIALTANAMESDRKACLEAGMTDFLSKPFTLDQLKKILFHRGPVAATP